GLRKLGQVHASSQRVAAPRGDPNGLISRAGASVRVGAQLKEPALNQGVERAANSVRVGPCALEYLEVVRMQSTGRERASLALEGRLWDSQQHLLDRPAAEPTVMVADGPQHGLAWVDGQGGTIEADAGVPR